MRRQAYLIDTNILIELEDSHKVKATHSRFIELASIHKVDIYVHEAAQDDIARDRDPDRQQISLSKSKKYHILKKQRGLTPDDLSQDFGPLSNPNDVVDATLLHALEKRSVDFLVTQDKGLHQRAQKRSPDLARRVLFINDATELLIQTYEPQDVPIRHVDEVEAHEINDNDEFFGSLRNDYPGFDDWWRKCVKEHRSCWAVYNKDNQLAGLIVRKDESAEETDAVTDAGKILKICTFKVAPESRGVKLGELLLKQALWYTQCNGYDLVYLTTHDDQDALMELLEYYGFRKADKNKGDEYIYERRFSTKALARLENKTDFEQARENYPRFVFNEKTLGFVIPIREKYHDTLYPDLR